MQSRPGPAQGRWRGGFFARQRAPLELTQNREDNKPARRFYNHAPDQAAAREDERDLQLAEGLRRQLRRAPDVEATVFGERRQTWRELATRSDRLAAVLHGAGMGPNDRVAMLALNADRYLEYMLGVWGGGGALNPVNTRWSPARGRLLAR